MPYDKRQVNGNGWEVYNTETQQVKAKHATKEDADRQLRLLRAIENNPNWEPRNA
jgi:hypothetical protein